MAGWIKWWRAAELNPVLNNNEPWDRYHCFIWLVESAATQHTVRYGVPLERGQLVVSERFMMETWHWSSRGKVRRFLKELEANHMVNQKRYQKRTIITVEKYGFYQSERTNNGTNNGTADGPNNKKIEGGRGPQRSEDRASAYSGPVIEEYELGDPYEL